MKARARITRGVFGVVSIPYTIHVVLVLNPVCKKNNVEDVKQTHLQMPKAATTASILTSWAVVPNWAHVVCRAIRAVNTRVPDVSRGG